MVTASHIPMGSTWQPLDLLLPRSTCKIRIQYSKFHWQENYCFITQCWISSPNVKAIELLTGHNYHYQLLLFINFFINFPHGNMREFLCHLSGYTNPVELIELVQPVLFSVIFRLARHWRRLKMKTKVFCGHYWNRLAWYSCQVKVCFSGTTANGQLL